MSTEEIRIRALELAVQAHSQWPSADIVAAAEAFNDFLIGEPKKSPREKIVAALDAANVK